MEIIQRGAPSLLKAIQAGAKQVSESNGLSKPLMGQSTNSQPQQVFTNSMVNSALQSQGFMTNTYVAPRAVTQQPSNAVQGYDYGVKFRDKLIKDINTLEFTKSYFPAIDSLMTLYAMGELDSSIIDSIKYEDLKEIKSILKDFFSQLD